MRHLIAIFLRVGGDDVRQPARIVTSFALFLPCRFIELSITIAAICFCASDHGTEVNRVRDAGAPFAVQRPVAICRRYRKVSESLNAASNATMGCDSEKAGQYRRSSPVGEATDGVAACFWLHREVR